MEEGGGGGRGGLNTFNLVSDKFETRTNLPNSAKNIKNKKQHEKRLLLRLHSYETENSIIEKYFI